MFEKSTRLAAIPTHLGGSRPSLDPYGQLLKSLIPGASGIAVYDARGTPLWIGSEYHGPDPQPLVEVALGEAPPLTTAEVDGFARDHEGSPAYAFRVRNDHGEVIAVCCLITRDSERRPYSLILALVRPVLECLKRELDARASVGALARNLEAHDHDLALLLEMPCDEGPGDELGALTQKCLDHLGCELAALVVPERGIAVCKAPAGVRPRADVLTRIHRQLLNWAQLQRRALIVNRVAAPADPATLPPFRILSVPVRHPSGRTAGFLALFRASQAPEFDLKDEQVVSLVTRRIAGMLATHYDPPTGLLTRSALGGQAQGLLAGGAGTGPHAVLYLDIDGLHAINENLGMEAGDEVIAKVAEVLRRKPRPNALSGRLTGDRFAVFLPGCDVAMAAEIAESVRACCADITCTRGEVSMCVSVSIGVAGMPEGAAAFEHGLAQAEIACKTARMHGRGTVGLPRHAAHGSGIDVAESALRDRLQVALDGHGFALSAQPILPLTGVAERPCFELLLRLRGADDETMGPAKFLAVADRHGLMTRIDRWVVGTALDTLKSHRGALAAAGVRFSINLSAAAIGDESFHEFLESRVRDSGVPPAMLCFEVGEAAAAGNLMRADRLMQRLRLQGCTFALDDFGAGLSSLGQLKTLPVSVLKIDGSLVREASSNQRVEAMVRAIAQLAHTMGMETVAEFVETDESRTRMAALGIDYGQGYAIGRPMPLAEVLADLALYNEVAGWS